MLETVTEGSLRDVKALCCCQDALLGAHGQDVSSLSFLLYQPCLVASSSHYNHKSNEHFFLLKNNTHCNRDVKKNILQRVGEMIQELAVLPLDLVWIPVIHVVTHNRI